MLFNYYWIIRVLCLLLFTGISYAAELPLDSFDNSRSLFSMFSFSGIRLRLHLPFQREVSYTPISHEEIFEEASNINVPQGLTEQDCLLTIAARDLNVVLLQKLEEKGTCVRNVTVTIDDNDDTDYFKSVVLLSEYFPDIERLSFPLHKSHYPAYETGFTPDYGLMHVFKDLTKKFRKLTSLEIRTEGRHFYGNNLRDLAYLPAGLAKLSIRLDGREVIPDDIREGFSWLKNLKVLNLESCNLHDVHLRVLGEMPFVSNLQELNIGNNCFGLSELQAFLKKCKNLKILKIDSLQQNGGLESNENVLLGDRLLFAILESSFISQLEELAISNNGITLDYSEDILNVVFTQRLCNLKSLYINEDTLHNTALTYLQNKNLIKKSTLKVGQKIDF